MSTELLPCPFCGTSVRDQGDVPETRQSSWLRVTLEAGTLWFVECFGCGACLIPTEHGTEEEAIEAWNTRANVPISEVPLHAGGHFRGHKVSK
jgi:hypothetical protein